MLGGAYLCFEGFEQAIADPNVDLVQIEKDKLICAIRTDYILFYRPRLL